MELMIIMCIYKNNMIQWRVSVICWNSLSNTLSPMNGIQYSRIVEYDDARVYFTNVPLSINHVGISYF